MCLKIIKIYNIRLIKKHFSSSILDTSDIHLTTTVLSLENYSCIFKHMHSVFFFLHQNKIVIHYFGFQNNSFCLTLGIKRIILDKKIKFIFNNNSILKNTYRSIKKKKSVIETNK